MQFCFWLHGRLLALGRPALPVLKPTSTSTSKKPTWVAHFVFSKDTLSRLEGPLNA